MDLIRTARGAGSGIAEQTGKGKLGKHKTVQVVYACLFLFVFLFFVCSFLGFVVVVFCIIISVGWRWGGGWGEWRSGWSLAGGGGV